MTKKELVKAISDLLGLPQHQVKQVVQKLLESVIETLADEGRVELRKFGVFEVKTRKPRNARNPKTGEKVPIPERSAVTFKPGKEMEARVMEVIARKARFAQLAETADPSQPRRPAVKTETTATAVDTSEADTGDTVPPPTPPPRISPTPPASP